jgi:hypothetical protein
MATSPFIPLPQLGPDLGEALVYGLTVNTGGILTVLNSTTDIYTLSVDPPNIQNTGRAVNLTGSPGHQEINAMNTRQRNQVITDDGYTLELKAYHTNNGKYDPSILLNAWLRFDYFWVTWIEGSFTGSIVTNQFYGGRGSIDKPFEGRGEQVTTFNFTEVDPGYPLVQQYTRFFSG